MELPTDPSPPVGKSLRAPPVSRLRCANPARTSSDSAYVMKTTTSLAMAVAAMFALGASAFADQQANQQSINKANTSGMKKGQVTAKTSDNRSMPVRAADNSTSFLKKTGQSIVHTPQIVSETFT